MNPLVVLKLLDLAMLGFTAWERYQEHAAVNREASERVAELRRKILVGEMSDEDAMAEIDAMITLMQSQRRAAFAALPKPTFDPMTGE